MSIFPLQEGKWYSLGQLREGVKAVFDRADFDKEFRHAMRENDQRRVPWAKAWNEEICPSSLLADRLGMADDVIFCWTPNGAADVEFQSGERAIKIQCTTAYPLAELSRQAWRPPSQARNAKAQREGAHVSRRRRFVRR